MSCDSSRNYLTNVNSLPGWVHNNIIRNLIFFFNSSSYNGAKHEHDPTVIHFLDKPFTFAVVNSFYNSLVHNNEV